MTVRRRTKRVAAKRNVSIFLLSSAMAFSSAYGAEVNEDALSPFSLHGFGTVGLAHSTESKADFLAHDLQAHGAGLSRSWSPDVDSRIGLQLNARITSQVSSVVQVVSEQRYDGSYKPEVEWANVKYEITPDFSVRAGRMGLPSFMVTDYRKVGYAVPWVRMPVEIYSLLPLTRGDGVDASYRMHFGEFLNTIQGIYGESSAHTPDDATVKAKNAWGVTDTLEHGPATVRFSYLKGRFTAESQQVDDLFNGFRQFGPQGIAIANKYSPDDKPLTFFSVGGSYDPGKWFVMGEWGMLDTNSVFGKREAWYASSGYRIGKFTPYATYASVKTKSQTSDQGVTVPGYYPQQVRNQAAMLNGYLNQMLGEGPDQRTVSLGVRWDFAKNAAFKMQFDHSDIGKGSPGTLDHMQPGFKPGGMFNVISLTVDFLF